MLSRNFLFIVLTVPTTLCAGAQSSSTSSSSSSGAVTAGGPSIPQPTIPTQTNSVEGDLLAFKALQSDAEAIAIDINGKVKDKKVVITSPSDQTLSSFQLWRFARLSMKQLDEKTRAMTPKPSPRGGGRSLLGVETAISSTLALIQTIGSFFTSNETSLGLAGTPQDQALQNAVGRSLIARGIEVSTPGEYPPNSFSTLDYTQSPFLSDLQSLETARTNLAIAIASKTQWDSEDAAEKAAEKQIQDLKDQDAANVKQHKPEVNKDKIAKLAKENKLHEQKKKVLSDNYADDSVKNLPTATATALLQVVDSFLSGLLNISAAAPAATGSGTTASAAPASTAPPATGSTTPTTPAPVQASAPANSIPPLVSILYGDGFARRLGITPTTPTPKLDDWMVLTMKSVEVAPTIYARSNFWGSRVEYGGGSIATYALFDFSGRLLCSGNAFDYGGRVRSRDLDKKFRGSRLNASKQPLFDYALAGCAAKPAPTGVQ